MTESARRRYAAAVAASLLLHAVVLAAFEAWRPEPVAVPASAEVVVEVALLVGEDGTGAEVPAVAPAGETASGPHPLPSPDPSNLAGEIAATPSPSASSGSPPAADKPAAGGSDTTADAASDPPPAVPRRVEAEPSSEDREEETHREVPPGAPAVVGPEPRPRRGAPSTPKSRPQPAGRPFASAAAPAAAAGPRTVAGAPSELAAYLSRVRTRIASRQSPLGGEQGRVGIRFDVVGDGSFTGLAAVSGDRGALAEAALRVVRRASPAPPIPSSLARDRIPMSVTIVFE